VVHTLTCVGVRTPAIIINTVARTLTCVRVRTPTIIINTVVRTLTCVTLTWGVRTPNIILNNTVVRTLTCVGVRTPNALVSYSRFRSFNSLFAFLFHHFFISHSHHALTVYLHLNIHMQHSCQFIKSIHSLFSQSYPVQPHFLNTFLSHFKT
jgi:hypothetical protein